MKANLKSEIGEILNFGKNIVDNKDISSFHIYHDRVNSLGKTIYSNVDLDLVKQQAIELINLKIEYHFLYKFFVIGRMRIDLLPNWKEEGKYLFYVERSMRILRGIFSQLHT